MSVNTPPYKAAHIRAWRKERGLTMVELAELSGLSQSHISKLERGLLPYNQQSIECLAKVLNVSPGTLVDLTPDGDNAPNCD